MGYLLAIAKLVARLELDPASGLRHRIRIQKAVYLAQALHLPFGYRFAWDRFGPYSSDLGADIGVIQADVRIREKAETVELTERAEEVFALVQTLAEVPSQWGEHEVEWLEVLTSLHFMASRLGIAAPFNPQEDERRDVEEELLKLKPHFGEVSVHFPAAWERLASVA